ncbi:metalloregulator ArsR/SmtB family transcription factor [Labrenzia sp. OB1]|uniref:ArsR/SmtB family transcription factor n=1 Tax=Labrenzia sp. OB1 TaxID=1561204 RepID=UPI0008394754|nr:metalloregulator ArsR/SmtB family transcription factor [Labrenzia sp. OB1]
MKLEIAAQGFAALGSEARLQVVLALVKAGEKGLTVGDIQSRTGMAASTLAHHLRFLSSAGLVLQEKDGRSVISRAAFDHLDRLAGYLLKECCAEENGCVTNGGCGTPDVELEILND